MNQFIKNRASEFGQLAIARAIYALAGGDYERENVDSEFVRRPASEYGQWAIADAFLALGGAEHEEKKPQEFLDRKPSEGGQKKIYDAIMALQGRVTIDSGGGSGDDSGGDSGGGSGGGETPSIYINPVLFSSQHNVAYRTITANAPNDEETIFVGLMHTTGYNLPDATQIGTEAFKNDIYVEEVSAPICTKICASAFYGAVSLTSINMPMCEVVENNAFYMASYLETLTLPSATTIEGNSLKNLAHLILPGDTVATLANTNAFGSSLVDIQVPANLVETYKQESNWSTYADKIIAIQEGE